MPKTGSENTWQEFTQEHCYAECVSGYAKAVKVARHLYPCYVCCEFQQDRGMEYYFLQTCETLNKKSLFHLPPFCYWKAAKKLAFLMKQETEDLLFLALSRTQNCLKSWSQNHSAPQGDALSLKIKRLDFSHKSIKSFATLHGCLRSQTSTGCVHMFRIWRAFHFRATTGNNQCGCPVLSIGAFMLVWFLHARSHLKAQKLILNKMFLWLRKEWLVELTAGECCDDHKRTRQIHAEVYQWLLVMTVTWIL